jgi:radical SAM superfamily enzyme YgiQ (UPF0313 family)
MKPLALWRRIWDCVPEDPFYQPRAPLRRPKLMTEPPPLPILSPLPAAIGIEKRFALLINPFYPKDPHGSFGKHVLTPSLALTSVAASTPPWWRVGYWDENLLQGSPPVEPIPEVVGITVHLTFAERAYALATAYRRLGARVILGGLHVQSCPDEAAPYADAIAIGDGVALWPQMLDDISQGCLRSRYECGYEGDYASDPQPRRDLVPGGSFLTTASLIATRGCRNRCGFCYLSTRGLRLPYRTRPVEDICAQLRADEQPYAVFIDNNLCAQPEYFLALCRALEPLDRIWSAAVSLDVTDDPALVHAMAVAGCTGVFIGFETLSDANLDQARKRGPRVEDYARRVRILHDHGIAVNGSFVLGFDNDGPDVFPRTAAWIEEQHLECATFHILTPYPGTPFFRELVAQGRLLHRDWSKYDTAHAVFRPKRMTPEQLELGYDWIYRRLFAPGSVWRRRPRDRAFVLPYLAAALLYKRANWLWPWLIRHQCVRAVWRPFLEGSRRSRRLWRRRLLAGLPCPDTDKAVAGQPIVPAGV